MSGQLPAPATSNAFECIKRVNESGAEFWSSRDFAKVLDYADYRNFEAVMEKAGPPASIPPSAWRIISLKSPK